VRHPPDGIEDGREVGLPAAVAAGSSRSRSPSCARSASRATNSGLMVGVAETADMPVTLPYFLVWKSGRRNCAQIAISHLELK
jgi:hypothetical protein